MNEFHYLLMGLVIGPLLSFFAGILGTLVAPTVHARLTLRSTQNIQKRILLLEESVEQTENMFAKPTLAAAEFAKLVTRVALANMMVPMVMILLMYLSFVSRGLGTVPGVTVPVPIYVLGGLVAFVLGGVAGYFVSQSVFRLRDAYRRVVRYETWRKATLDEIEELRQRLSQAEASSVTQQGAEVEHPERTPQGELVIHKATFGADGMRVDVTGIVRLRVSGGRLEIPVTPHYLGSDPAVGVVKDLVVNYSYAGQRHTVRVREGGILTLPEGQDQAQE